MHDDHRATTPPGAAGARPTTVESRRLDGLRAEARYHRERYDLYKAKMFGLRPTSMSRLRELERAHRGAEARLWRAEHDGAPPGVGDERS